MSKIHRFCEALSGVISIPVIHNTQGMTITSHQGGQQYAVPELVLYNGRIGLEPCRDPVEKSWDTFDANVKAINKYLAELETPPLVLFIRQVSELHRDGRGVMRRVEFFKVAPLFSLGQK